MYLTQQCHNRVPISVLLTLNLTLLRGIEWYRMKHNKVQFHNYTINPHANLNMKPAIRRMSVPNGYLEITRSTLPRNTPLPKAPLSIRWSVCLLRIVIPIARYTPSCPAIIFFVHI